MLNLLLLLMTPIIFALFNPTTHDYCNSELLSCHNEHVVCKCTMLKTLNPARNIVAFRQDIIDIHNNIRNQYARGGGEVEINKKIMPSAANMRVLNYDLELEYFARCAAKKFAANLESCRTYHDGNVVGQNLGMSAEKSDVKFYISKNWYASELKAVDFPIMKNFTSSVNSKGIILTHLLQLLYANADLIGCAKFWKPGAFLNNEDMKEFLICNYHSTTNVGAIAVGTPIYIQGEPCSSCPRKLRCQDLTYINLCGQLKAIPIDPPFGKSMKRYFEGKILFIGVFLLFFVAF